MKLKYELKMVQYISIKGTLVAQYRQPGILRLAILSERGTEADTKRFEYAKL